MNCPHCHEVVAADYKEPRCPHCGKNLVAATPADDAPIPPRTEFQWKLYLCALLGPAVLTFVSAAVLRLASSQSRSEGFTPVLALIGSIIGGIICGVVVGLQNRHPIARVVLILLMSFIMTVVCLAFCLVGCGIGGYRLRIGG